MSLNKVGDANALGRLERRARLRRNLAVMGCCASGGGHARVLRPERVAEQGGRRRKRPGPAGDARRLRREPGGDAGVAASGWVTPEVLRALGVSRLDQVGDAANAWPAGGRRRAYAETLAVRQVLRERRTLPGCCAT